jgi:hypothetical protein
MVRTIAVLLVCVALGYSFGADMSPAESMRLLAEAGIRVSARDAFGPPSSFLEREADGTFSIYLYDESLTNIAVLASLPVSDLRLHTCKLRDLTPLATLPLQRLELWCVPDADLSSLKGKTIRNLDISRMAVRDLSILQGMTIEALVVNPYVVTNGLEALADMPQLREISTHLPNVEYHVWTRRGFKSRLESWGFHPDSSAAVLDGNAIRTRPFSINMTASDGLRDTPWHLTVGTSGVVNIMLYERGVGLDTTMTAQTLTSTQLISIRQSVADNEFFSLECHYGDKLVDDFSHRGISIRVGDCQKTVRMASFENRLIDHDPQLKTLKRLLRVWQAVASLVDLPTNCVSFEAEDRRVMESDDRAEKIKLRLMNIEVSVKDVAADSVEMAVSVARDLIREGLVVGDSYAIQDEEGKRQKWKLVSADGTNVVVRMDDSLKAE